MVAIVAAAVGAWLIHKVGRFSEHEIYTVHAGVLYRSGRPDEQALRDCRDRWHFRTIIDLCEDFPTDPSQKLEEDFCRASGIRYVPLALELGGFTEPQLAQFLEIVQNPAGTPVLVHCKHGRNRTGYAVAVYRIVVQHWSYEAAVAEARKYRTLPDEFSKYEEHLRTLAGAAAPGK
jgi:protein tyrosine/serine phosphatase